MSRTDSARLTDHGPLVPSMGTFPSSANTLYPKGTIVTRSSAGRAVSPSTADLSGNPALGIAKATFLNRTGDEMGGLDDSGLIEVDYGIFFFDFVGTTPITDQALYVVDNQTVSTDPSTGRGYAGVCTEVRTMGGSGGVGGRSQVGVFMGPAAPIATGSLVEKEIPLEDFTLSDGTPLAVFANASSPTFGLTVVGSKSTAIRWNNDPTPGTAFCAISLPSNFDASRPAVLEFTCSKSGATVGDATTLTVGAFPVSIGDLYDANADVGGVSNAIAGAAVAKTTALLTRTIAAAAMAAGVRVMNISVKPTAGTLGTDDFLIHECRLKYYRK